MAKQEKLPTCSNHPPAEVRRIMSVLEPETYKDGKFLSERILDQIKTEYGGNRFLGAMIDGMKRSFDEMRVARPWDKTAMGHMLFETPMFALMANLLSTEVGSNTVAQEVSMVETRLEHQSMGSILDIIGYDRKKASGTFCSGGTSANLTALAVARKEMEAHYARIDKVFPNQVWVLTTGMAHYSIPKAVDILGGPKHNIKIMTVATEGLKMSTKDLELKIAKAKKKGIPVMAVIGIMGETETGLVDDMTEINRIAHENGIFTIADGAYGAPYKLSREGKRFKGIEEADAVVLDVHKNMLGVYNGSGGVVCFKDAMTHAGLAKGVTANYIGINVADDFEEFEKHRPEIAKSLINGTARLGAKRLEGSGGAGSILIVRAIEDTIGKEGLAVLYDLALERIGELKDRLDASKYFRPYHDPELNLLCFTLRDEILKKLGLDGHSEEFHQLITETRLVLDGGIVRDGGYYFSETDLPDEGQKDKKKKFWTWRACIMNPKTTTEIINAAVDNLELLIEDRIAAKESPTGMLTRK